jgi:dUTP pyrophosphatase
MISISIRNQSSNELPEYATAGAAGLDIRAHLSEAITLQPLERRLIPTGLFLEIPLGYEVQIRPRSGLAFKHGITAVK